MFQIGEYFYMLNMQSETYTNYSFNPYYGRVSLFRVPIKDYIAPQEDAFAKKSYERCLIDLVPGVITHFSLSHQTKNKMIINYRRIDENKGIMHRFRLYHNLTECNLNQSKPYNLEDHINEILVYDILSSYNKKEETFEDFGVNGSFTITSVNLNS